MGNNIYTSESCCLGLMWSHINGLHAVFKLNWFYLWDGTIKVCAAADAAAGGLCGWEYLVLRFV